MLRWIDPRKYFSLIKSSVSGLSFRQAKDIRMSSKCLPFVCQSISYVASETRGCVRGQVASLAVSHNILVPRVR